MIDSPLRAALFWSCLQVLTPERYEAIIKVFGNLTEASRHVDADVLRSLGCREKSIASVLERLRKSDPDEEEKLLLSSHARIITLFDGTYPRALEDISDAPVFLYAQGDLSILTRPCVALVGTRKMSAYGGRVAQEFASALAHAGIVTVSGLAKGIDSLVADETIKEGGKTVAVLGQGLLTLSSESRRLADRIIEAGGVVLSEFPLRMPADMFTFPRRNRIIAGLSLATVVLEAPESSGALITAKLAFDYGRDVFAVPGQMFDANFSGCHALIKAEQAKITTSPRDVLEDLGVIVSDEDAVPSGYVAKNPEEERILTALSSMPLSVDDLLEKTMLAAGTLSSILTMLELNGAVKNLGQGQWIKM